MELAIGLIGGVIVVFLFLFMYRLGIKDGRAQKESKPLEPIVKREPKLSKEEIEEQEKLYDQFNAIMAYNPYEVTDGK